LSDKEITLDWEVAIAEDAFEATVFEVRISFFEELFSNGGSLRLMLFVDFDVRTDFSLRIKNCFSCERFGQKPSPISALQIEHTQD
jgi:hypothetical protein